MRDGDDVALFFRQRGTAGTWHYAGVLVYSPMQSRPLAVAMSAEPAAAARAA